LINSRHQVRAFIVANDLLVWNVFSALHQSVRDELKLGPDVIPLNLFGVMGDEAVAVVTDNTRNTSWWHDGNVAAVIEDHPFMLRNFKSVEIDFYDSDVVGDWRSINDDNDDDANEDE
jgi:hypothetical protein